MLVFVKSQISKRAESAIVENQIVHLCHGKIFTQDRVDFNNTVADACCIN